MYNTKVICTYNTDEIFSEMDKINSEDETFIRDAIYRQELLNIFGIEEYNDKEMNDAIHNLYEKVKECKECKELKECMVKLSSDFMSLDEELGLLLLYSYDYMYLTHICVSEFLETGKISHNNIFNLKNQIFNILF
jgi:hypothetical protein